MNQKLTQIANPRFSSALVALLLFVTVGCAPDEEVHTDYGRRGGWTQTSLNGTRTLGELFERAGHTVRSWRYLSPSLDEADVIVWAPNDFEPPSLEVRDWLVEWVSGTPSERGSRVLIYVGRDYDAAPDYWQRMQAKPPAGLKKEYTRRFAEAKSDAASNRPNKLQETDCEDWFVYDPSPKKRTRVKGLTGPWARGVDASQLEIDRQTKLVASDLADILLADKEGSPIVSQIAYDNYDDYSSEEGRVVFVENGSFLLNGALVNHEHRKLAGKLVVHVGPAKKRVVFLESGGGGPAIRDIDPSTEPPTGLALFRVWPIGAALTQLAALGIIFALMKWPLFGLPRQVASRSNTDLGSHIAALGRLLRDSKDRRHAVHLLRLYRQSAPHVTVVSNAPPPLVDDPSEESSARLDSPTPSDPHTP